MILFSAKRSAVHDMHLDAIAQYAAPHDIGVTARIDGARAIPALLRNRDRIIFSQSTGPASALVLPLARLLGKTVVHYMHEPSRLRKKLRANPFMRSVIRQTVQWIEMHSASKVMVSREPLVERAASVYHVSPRKLVLAPLLMPAPTPSSAGEKTRITYLGRIDERRYFQDFLHMAPALKRRGFQPTILTGDVGTLKKYANTLPAEIDLQAEANFSEDLKARILGETLVLWNPKRGEISQSGVTADAVRYGLPILLTDKDPAYSDLLANGIALDFDTARDTDFACLDNIDTAHVAQKAAALFSRIHGADAFRTFYLPHMS